MTPENISLVKGGFNYLVELFAPDGTLMSSEKVHNMIPQQGLDHIPAVVFKNAAQAAAWYIAPFEGNYDPSMLETAATIATASTESTAYTPAARVLFASSAVALGAVDNAAARAEFTFTAAKRIYGGFLVSSSVKAGATGVLMSIVRFASPKDCDIGSVLRITAGVGFTSA